MPARVRTFYGNVNTSEIAWSRHRPDFADDRFADCLNMTRGGMRGTYGIR